MKIISGFTLIITALTLSGCSSFTSTLQTVTTEITGSSDNCMIENAKLSELLAIEHKFLNAKGNEQKSLLKSTKTTPVERALLLSSPEASSEQMTQALKVFSKLSLLPTKNCVADRYLYLRFRHTQAQSAHQNQIAQSAKALKQSELQVTELQNQIQALTEIEQSITRQRKDQ